MVNLHPIARRIAALGLLLLVVVAFHLAVTARYFAFITETQDRLEQQRMLLGRLAGVAAQEAQLPDLENRAVVASKSKAFTTGASDAMITASLQSRLGVLAAGAGIRVRTTRALSERNRDGIRLLGVQVQLTANVAQVQRILHAIEATQPVLFVEGLHLTASSGQRASGEEPELLDTRMDVFAAIAPDRT